MKLKLRILIVMILSASAFASAPNAWAWDEQRVLEYVMAYNPLLRAYHVVTEEYTPPQGVIDRVKEYTSVYGRAGAGGTDFRDQPFIVQAGIQINIPLASTKERREKALKAVEEVRAMDEVRSKVLAAIAKLRQTEADLDASKAKLKFYKSKSKWLQKRVKEGYSTAEELWPVAKDLNEERATNARLRTMLSTQQYQLASYAGDRWKNLLAYLQGKGDLK